MKKTGLVLAGILFCNTLLFSVFAQDPGTLSPDEAADLSGAETLTDAEYAKMAGGCVLPSPEELAKLDAKAVKITPDASIAPNDMGLKRINDERAKKGKKPLTMKEATALLEERFELIKSGASSEKIKAFDEKENAQ